jgi:hypothetical protein
VTPGDVPPLRWRSCATSMHLTPFSAGPVDSEFFPRGTGSGGPVQGRWAAKRERRSNGNPPYAT